MVEEKITKEQIEEAKKKLIEKKGEAKEEKTESKVEETKTKETEIKQAPAKKVQEDIKSPDPQKPKVSKERKERIGILNIYTTFNNTIMSLTDLSGKSIARFSGGQSTKQDR